MPCHITGNPTSSIKGESLHLRKGGGIRKTLTSYCYLHSYIGPSDLSIGGPAPESPATGFLQVLRRTPPADVPPPTVPTAGAPPPSADGRPRVQFPATFGARGRARVAAMKLRSKGASNASRRPPPSPGHSVQNSPPPAESTPQVRPEQFDALVQQVQALATAVQSLQPRGIPTAPLPPAPVQPVPPASGFPLRGQDSQVQASLWREHPARGPGGWPQPSEAESVPGQPTPKRTAAAIPQNDELDKKVEKLERQIEALHGRRPGRDGDFEFTTRSPFSQQIEDEPVPSRFKMPQVEPYNGRTDPLDHLESYRALMALQGASEAMLCKAFPATLRGPARLWFTGLKPSTVSSFEQLGRQFTSNFVLENPDHAAEI